MTQQLKVKEFKLVGEGVSPLMEHSTSTIARPSKAASPGPGQDSKARRKIEVNFMRPVKVTKNDQHDAYLPQVLRTQSSARGNGTARRGPHMLPHNALESASFASSDG